MGPLLGRPVKILSVEDNPADVMMIQEMFREGNLRTELEFVKDGADALDYLFQRGSFTSANAPDFILLDLNLPKVDGKEVLKEIKKHPTLREIPVIVFSSSSRREDVQSSYNLYANAFVTKPRDLQEFENAIRAIERFWISTATLASALPV